MKICLQNLLAFSVPTFYWRSKYCAKHISGKGQLISKAIYGLLTSPKKRTDKLVLFAFLLFTANKSNSSFPFWENLWLVNLLFSFNWPLINTLYQWFGYMSWGYQEKLFFDVPAYEGWVRRWMYIPYGHLVLYHRQDHMKKKKKRKNDLWSRVPYTDLFFFSCYGSKKYLLFHSSSLSNTQ